VDEERPDDELPRGMPTTVFVSDPSAEAERVAQLLRSRGYLVADVPLTMLVARVAVQRPRVLLVDADADGALETLAKMREIAEADGIDVVFFGKEGGAVGSVEAALGRDGSGFFRRPVDVPTLLKKLEALTGGPTHGPMARPSTPPPSVSSMALEPAQRRPGSLPPPSMRDVSAASPPPRGSMHIPRVVAPPAAPVPSFGPEERRSPSAQVSTELEHLLAEAERRIGGQVTHESVFPTPEEEIEAVLPADVLASLDEPIDGDDEIDEPAEIGAHAKGTTSGGTRMSTGSGTGVGTNAGARLTNPKSPPTDPPMPKTSGGGTHAGTTSGRFTDFLTGQVPVRTDASGGSIPQVDSERPRVGSNPPGQGLGLPPNAMDPPHALPREAPIVTHAGRPSPPTSAATVGLGLGPSAPMPSVLAPGDAARAVAHAIVTRATGALCIESQEGVRRAVFREGDLVTSASGVDSESLLAFLVARGDLPRDDVQGLVGKLPPFGRHAGAALVAHGHLRQDQLWSVLREHAEWILGRMIQQSTGTALIEGEPPGRLRGEPSVFERSTGAEVFVEVVRRVVAPEDALARLGGAASRIADGPAVQLESECALEPSIGERLQNARGNAIQSLLDRSPEPDAASVLYALDLLGIVEMVRAIGEPRHPSPPAVGGQDTLDEDAVRARVRARLQLVDEGDYFALLGVPRSATSYEVRRAFVDLRRAFEPARILNPQIADLNEDVRKIATVLDEAYEILKDNARRERYRRAIEGPTA
jgi:hypothetical protein